MEPKIYSLDTFMPIQVTAKAKCIAFNRTLSTKNIAVGNEVSIMCHARCNGIPDVSLYDYSSNLSKSSLVIPVPKCPKWYFSIQAVYQPKFQEEKLEEEVEVCLSIEWEVIYCKDGKDGPNCAGEEHELKMGECENLVP
ncbi:hypothetical protein PanWU01x14_135890 [Parasponia andersonii]|uniref:Uncharacterized protein n=1 Tax=Parasponia andersonii TaxID=3476 RepID=A0A2P5CPE5_PARAD|nr:hypothetical protein PanWU01x14_135890 [Parasponia andersonii]